MTGPVQVRVVIDFNCPASYLAVAPTRALESKLREAFQWLPFPAVTRTRPRIAVSDDDRSARHFRMRSEYIDNELRRYAASRGLDIGDIHRSADTTAASLGLLWLGRHNPAAAGEYAAAVFDRIRRDNAEVDLNFVVECLGTAATGFPEYAAGDGPRDLEATRQQLSAEGVWNVPAYLVGSELFIGRQHLPMVERLAMEKRELASA